MTEERKRQADLEQRIWKMLEEWKDAHGQADGREIIGVFTAIVCRTIEQHPDLDRRALMVVAATNRLVRETNVTTESLNETAELIQDRIEFMYTPPAGRA